MCKGCIQSVRISEYEDLGPTGSGRLATENYVVGLKYGHVFNVAISVKFTACGENCDSGCKLLWYEHTTRAYSALNVENMWTNIFAESCRGPGWWEADNPIFNSWSLRSEVHEVQNSKTSTIDIVDWPNLPLGAEARKRILQFCLVATCTPGCDCSTGYKYTTAVQGLKVGPDEGSSERYFQNGAIHIGYGGKGIPTGVDLLTPSLQTFR